MTKKEQAYTDYVVHAQSCPTCSKAKEERTYADLLCRRGLELFVEWNGEPILREKPKNEGLSQ